MNCSPPKRALGDGDPTAFSNIFWLRVFLLPGKDGGQVSPALRRREFYSGLGGDDVHGLVREG